MSNRGWSLNFSICNNIAGIISSLAHFVNLFNPLNFISLIGCRHHVPPIVSLLLNNWILFLINVGKICELNSHILGLLLDQRSYVLVNVDLLGLLHLLCLYLELFELGIQVFLGLGPSDLLLLHLEHFQVIVFAALLIV